MERNITDPGEEPAIESIRSVQKYRKIRKNRPHNNVKEGNDRSVGLQLLTNPFDSRPRFAEKFIVERDPTKFRNLILSLPAEHEVNRFSNGLRVAAVP